MTLHDKVAADAALASAAYLLRRALGEIGDAWQTCISAADYANNSEFNDASHTIRSAIEITEGIGKRFKEANKCTLP